MRMNFLDRGFGINRTWVAVAIGGSAVVGAGAGLIGSSMNKGKPQIQNEYAKGPDFQINQDATNSWLNQLTQDQQDPTGNFGAISPDWNDIWAQTQKQVQQYYHGTATSPGVNDQIKASFAQRGMSGDPAASYLTAASGANEASDLSTLGAQQNIAKQTFANQGKQNWLNSIASFQNQTSGEAGNWSGAVVSPTSGQQAANIIGTAGSGVASAAIQAQGQNNQLNWLQGLTSNPTTFAPASGAGPTSYVTNGGFGF